MSFEDAAKPQEPKKPESPGLMSRLGDRWKKRIAALGVVAATETAMEGVAEAKSGSRGKPAASERKREEKPDRALEARKIWAEEMTISGVEEFPGADGDVVIVFRGEGEPVPDGRKRFGIGITVIDEGDPKVQGDEKRYDVLIETQQGNKDYEEETKLKDRTPQEARDSGRQLQNPFGEVKLVEKDGRMEYATDADQTRARINKYYWAIKGLKQAGQLDTPQGKQVVREFKGHLEQGLRTGEIEIDREAAKKAYEELFS